MALTGAAMPATSSLNLTGALKTVNIFCHVERLGPVYDKGWVHFSVNLSAALVDGSDPIDPDDVRRFLTLWEWSWDTLAILGIDDQNKTVTLDASDIAVLIDQLPSTTPSSEALKRALIEEREAIITQIDPSLRAFKADIQTPLESKVVDERTRTWKGFLAHVSTFPAPLPQTLKLSVFFRVDSEALKRLGVKQIVASPVFTAGGPLPNRAPQLPPAGQKWDVTDQRNPLHRVPGAPDSPDYYSWQYDTAAGPQILASLNDCSTDPVEPDPGSFLNLRELWVTKSTSGYSASTQGAALSEDWTLRFEIKLADAFDFPRRLLDSLGMNIQHWRDTGELFWPVDSVFHSGFLASLRDLANLGLGSPPEGRSLAEVLVAQRKGPVAEIVSLLRSYEAQTYRTFDRWLARLKEFLASVDGGVQGSSSLPDVPLPEQLSSLPAYAQALERVYSLLAADANVVSFLYGEWEKALQGNNFWNSHSKDIARTLTDLQLRKRMALANCGIAWRSLSGNLHDRHELLISIKGAFATYFDHRFGGAPDSEYKTYLPPISSHLPERIGQDIATFAESFVDKILLPIEPTNDEIGSFAEDLIIQVDRVERMADRGSAGDRSDYLRRIAGLGVLLRKQGVAEWRCLSLARLEVRGAESTSEPVPVPVRSNYRNGLRRGYLQYLNQPMAAQSPAAGLSRTHEMGQGSNRTLPILGYANPYSAANGPRLESLVYETVYEAAVFIHGNAGNLPPELTVRDATGRTVPWKFQFPPAGSPLPFTQSIPYLRRVPVGLVRLGAAGSDRPKGPKQRDGAKNEEMDRLELPPIPDTVLPLTRSLHVGGSDLTTDREPTLLLLTPSVGPWSPNRSRYDFVVRPPSTTLEVWDRWVAEDSTIRQKRTNVWARFHELADVPDGTSKAAKPSIMIDDPAVSEIEFRFTQVYGPKGQSVPSATLRCPVPPAPGDCSSDLKCVQAAPIPIQVYSSEALSLPTTCSEPILIGIPPGGIWQLDIVPVISDPSRFCPKLQSETGKPVTLYVEVASPLIDGNVDDLRAALNLALKPAYVEEMKPESKAKDERLVVSLEPSAPHRLWNRIHRVELLLQRWRWDGRPVCYFEWAEPDSAPAVHYGFPIAAAVEGALEAFDGSLFASRESSDYLSLPAHVDFAAPTSAGREVLYERDLSSLPGALYFRVGVRVFSRYEGLLLRDEALDSRPAVTPHAEQWRRLVVPCRWNKPVPQPSIKLVLPLTQSLPAYLLSVDTAATQSNGSDDESATPPPRLTSPPTPGFLVVLDESWYSDTLGGFGESFEWEVVRASLPDVIGDSRAELSPDPILDLTEDPFAGRDVQMFPAIGAIGYTQDTSTLAPLFTRASFVVPSPAVEGVSDLSWHFVKLRFRRRLPYAPLLAANTSAWTDPVWAQLLPPSNLVRVRGSDEVYDVGTLVFDRSLIGFRNRTTKQQVWPLPLAVGNASTCVFELWVLLTRRIVDALGRRNQESFIKLVPLDKLGEAAGLPPETVARLVEVQHRNDIRIPTVDALLRAMFPDMNMAEPADVTARVVRVFTPIETEP